MAAVAENAIGSDNQFIHRSRAQETDYQNVRKLVDLLSKLNPSAKEFFPSSYSVSGRKSEGRLSADAPILSHRRIIIAVAMGTIVETRRNGYFQGRRRTNDRVRRAEREESIRRTVYVSDIDQNVTEEHLAELFANCGQVVDCRVCGDPHSVLRFAFIEFADEGGFESWGTMLGFYPVRVLPSKTAIVPVNPKFLPRSNDEREMVVRTVYCTNIDKKVTQADVKNFFEQVCGEVSCLRLLGDNIHSTRIAFVEFIQSAILALNCSGMILGSLPIRVSPSKTPVRPRIPRASSQ
ncbi:hypothetical protein HPP92_008220 [Vanilla planifolia]|uniref:RRM domain-containing protein n=1 Tax=Vanilla planifolia TaxID=51239 RepID=A0A835RE28_VANPL|nr:hypothetical protein HPP92_008220 [Vanilla planifolia]